MPAERIQTSTFPLILLFVQILLQVLYLSRNRLTALEGVHQFINLRVFSAGDNELATFACIAPLKSLRLLEAVSLESNPVADLPNYRARMISMLGESLQSLDGRPVTTEDRRMAADTCTIEDTLINLAVSNAVLAEHLDRALHIAQLHSELYSKFPHQSAIDEQQPRAETVVGRLPAHWSSHEPVDLAHRSKIEASIAGAVSQIHQRVLLKGGKTAGSATWHLALCHVLADQLAAVENLINSSISKTAAGAYGKEMTRKENSRGGSAWTGVFLSLRQTLAKLNTLRPGEAGNAQQAQNLSQQILDLNTHLLKSLSDGKEDVENDAGDWLIPAAPLPEGLKLLGTGARPEASALSSPSKQHSALSGRDVGLAARYALASEDNARLKMQLERAENEAAQAHQAAADHALANETLRREYEAAQVMVTSLQSWLERANQHAEEADIEKEGLEVEVEILRRKLGEAEAAAQKSGAALARIQDTVSDLTRNTLLLQAELQTTEQAMKDSSQPIALEISVSFAEEFQEERKKSTILSLELADALQRAAAAEAELAAERERQARDAVAAEVRAHLDAHRKAHLIRVEEYALGFRARKIAAAGLAAWRTATQRSQRIDHLTQRRKRALVLRVLRQWQSYARSAVLLAAMDLAAMAAATFTLARRALAGWIKAARVYRQVELPDHSVIMLAAAGGHRRHILKKAFSAWRDLTQDGAMTRESLVLLTAAQTESRLLGTFFSTWRIVAAVQKEELEEQKRGNALRASLLLRQTLLGWQRHSRRATALAAAESAAVRGYKIALMSRALDAWLRVLVESTAERAARKRREAGLKVAEQRAIQRQQSAAVSLQREAVFAWRCAVVSHRDTRALSTWSASACRRQLLNKAFGVWRVEVLEQRAIGLEEQINELEEVLRGASRELGSRETQIGTFKELRKDALSRAEELTRELLAARDELEALRDEVDDLEGKLANTEAQKALAEQFGEEALAAAQLAASAERRARCAAQEASRAADSERNAAECAAREASTEAAAAREACAEAQQRASAAEEAQAEAELVAMKALEDASAASNAYERFAQESSTLKTALEEAQQRNKDLSKQLEDVLNEVQTLKLSSESLRIEESGLRTQIVRLQRQLRVAEEEKEAAENDAHVAIRQAHRLTDMMEQHAQQQNLESVRLNASNDDAGCQFPWKQ